MFSESHPALFWAPRLLCILFIAFVSAFALDVFSDADVTWQTFVHLAVHLIPTFVMLGALMVAWRWEWIGAVEFTACAVYFAFLVRGPWWGKAIFVAPCLVSAGLFLLDWLTTHHRSSPAR